jgi:molybdate transport system substrate-binding protein
MQAVLRILKVLAVATAVLAAACKSGRAADTEVMLAVAASLRNVMPELTKAFAERHPGIRIAATYGASGDLRKQVEGGAPIDAVVLANSQPVDELIANGRLDPPSRRVLATNQLVLIGPKGAKDLTFATLDALPAGERLAIGDPGSVPAGQYARDALKALGKWDALRGRLVFGGDVAAVLAYARRGEVAAAIVYRTETRGIDDVVVLDQAVGPWAPRAEVVAAAVNDSKASLQAHEFIEFVASPEGQRILAASGFGAP